MDEENISNENSISMMEQPARSDKSGLSLLQFIFSAIIILCAILTLPVYTVIKHNDSKKKLAGLFEDFYEEKFQNADSLLSFILSTSIVDSEILAAVNSYLILYPKDTDAKAISDMLTPENEKFQEIVDSFYKKNSNSIFCEYVEFLNVIKRNGIKEDFSLLPDFEKKHPNSKYLEYLKILEICSLLFDAETVSEKSKVLKDKADSIYKTYPKSKACEVFKKLEIQYSNEEKNGIWSIKRYVDNYNEYTNQKYIGSTDINGIYTSSTADRKKSAVRFLINGQTSICLKLYENGDTVRGADLYHDYYDISIKDDNNEVYDLEGENNDDRIKLDEDDSRKLHLLLKSNKKLRFYIVRNTSKYETKYSFTVDCDGYGYVYEKFLNEK